MKEFIIDKDYLTKKLYEYLLEEEQDWYFFLEELIRDNSIEELASYLDDFFAENAQRKYLSNDFFAEILRDAYALIDFEEVARLLKENY